MKLRNGKYYIYNLKTLWWYKYTIEGFQENSKYNEVSNYCSGELYFTYNIHTVKEFIECILPLYGIYL